MEKDLAIFETLLGGLDESDYDSLIFREELKMEGWKFNYILDADVIANYCFPFGLDINKNDFRKNRHYSSAYYADEQLTLHSIFYLNLINNEQNIILDDYIPELRGMLRLAKLVNQNQSFSGKFQFNQLFNSKKGDVLGNESEEIKKTIKEEFSQIFSNFLFRMEGLKKFSLLCDQKKIILNIEDINSIALKRALNESVNIQDLDDTSFVDIEKKESKKIDRIVIQKLITINEYFLNSGKKELVCLIGDSPITARIFKSLAEGIGRRPEYNKINSNFAFLYYPVQEFFAYLICREFKKNKEIDNLKTQDNLKALKSASKKIKRMLSGINSTSLNMQEDDIDLNEVLVRYKELFSNYSHLRNSFENIGLLGNIEGLMSSFQTALDKDLYYEAQEIYNKIIGNSNQMVNELVSERDKILTKLISEAKFNAAFIRGISLIQNKHSNFIISKGVDPVEGTYQHLPIFILFKDPGTFEVYKFTLSQIIEMILNFDVSKSSDLFKKLEILLIKLNDKKSSDNLAPEEKLIKAFIALLLPSDSTEKENIGFVRQNDLYVYEWFKDILSNIKKDNIPTLLLSEFWYVFIWVSRRVKDYEISEIYCKQGMARFPRDPRFFHGYFLLSYCKYIDSVSEHNENENLTAINNLTKIADEAYLKYQSFAKENYTNNNLVIERIDDCFNNNFCYLYSEKAYFLKDVDKEVIDNNIKNRAVAKYYIEKARIKLSANKRNFNYKTNLSEYYDTEAHLEFVESFFLEGKKVLEKLNYASLALENALKFTTNPDLKEKYLKRQSLIKERLLAIQ